MSDSARSAPDSRPDDPADGGETLSELQSSSQGRALTDVEALFVLSLARDGRPIPEALASRARERCLANARLVSILDDFSLLSAVLSEEAQEAAPEGFTASVLGRARGLVCDTESNSRPELGQRSAGSLRLARRLALAATLLLALTLGWDALTPAPAAADPAQEQQVYRGDVFRVDPYGPVDLQAGLRELLPGRLDPLQISDDGALPPTADPAGDSPTEPDSARPGGGGR